MTAGELEDQLLGAGWKLIHEDKHGVRRWGHLLDGALYCVNVYPGNPWMNGNTFLRIPKDRLIHPDVLRVLRQCS